MKMFFSMIAVLVLCPLFAHASETYRCRLDGNIHGLSLGFGISGQLLNGTGTLTCQNEQTGAADSEDVKLALVGGGVGFDFTIVKGLRVHAAGVETNRGLEDLHGSFSVGAIAGAQVLSDGVSVDTSVRVSGNGLGFDIGLIGENAVGLGVRLQGMAFSIQPE